MKICIPSKERPNDIKTLKFLEKVPPKDIYIFVEPQDLKEYKKVNEQHNIIDIKKNDMGINFVRNFIINYMFKKEKQKYIWMLDDDIMGFSIREGYNKEKKYHKLRLMSSYEVVDMFEGLKDWAKENDYVQVGLSHVIFNWCKKHEYDEYVSCFQCVFLDLKALFSNNIKYDTNLTTGGDMDMCAQILKAGLKNAVTYNHAFKCLVQTQNKGGLYSTYKSKKIKERTKKDCDYLVRKYGNFFISIRYNEKRKLFEPLFKWKNFRKSKSNLEGFLK